jgi:hypothetical protein
MFLSDPVGPFHPARKQVTRRARPAGQALPWQALIDLVAAAGLHN